MMVDACHFQVDHRALPVGTVMTIMPTSALACETKHKEIDGEDHSVSFSELPRARRSSKLTEDPRLSEWDPTPDLFLLVSNRGSFPVVSFSL